MAPQVDSIRCDSCGEIDLAPSDRGSRAKARNHARDYGHVVYLLTSDTITFDGRHIGPDGGDTREF